MGLNEKFFKSADEEAEPFFNTVLYPGNGGTNPITGVGFQPDLVWIKRRNSTGNPGMIDALRGNNSVLFTSLQAGEATLTGGNISMDVDGFDINTYPSAWANSSGGTYVAWCFKAEGAAVSNTDGSITSQVSANVASGFSIVKWSATTTTSDIIGHGLDSKPELVIMKKTSNTSNWFVYTDLIDGSLDYLLLNTTAGKANSTLSVPTSSVFTQGNLGGMSANDSCIAYCFHSVAGVSKVGTYTGGSGATVNTGFRPSWVMVKRTDNTPSGDWFIYDDVRGEDEYLLANTGGEEESYDNLDFTATGFNLKANNASLNRNGATYIYYAIA